MSLKISILLNIVNIYMGNILTIALTYDYWCKHKRKKHKEKESALEKQIKDNKYIIKLIKKNKNINF